MHQNVTIAVARLQLRRRRVRGSFAVEQAEEAMDLLLRNPERSAAPPILMRNALTEARRKLLKRQQLLTEYHEMVEAGGVVASAAGIVGYELKEFIKDDVRTADAPLLKVALAGGSAEEIARVQSIPIQRARERLSRARARAHELWIN
jgi:hypothetical protein